ncbi:5'-methylthioadenosine/S-adenosylhomocysteine nucleosidase [Bacillus kwashiorkori]|uniref:5'-methylthioadenosine/S-adenosylhomocysteine nucleosidase n=1 Tax=Bacillus kwashiorkori TaxID=1522318 RepID=UPI0007805828|nr:5'-methylthioadenosine/S-adenosylhomocysteine nucleosidase [Bacillus kwashiorkori]
MKIAIIGAMEEEVRILREQLSNKTSETIANCEFTIGTLFNKEVILLKSGIGKVNAAMATSILLERYSPDYIINTGSAGGLNPELKIGDLVISNEVRHHDVDATAFGYEIGQVPQMPPAYQANEYLVNIAMESAKEIAGVQTVIGLIATGDSFMSDANRVRQVGENFTQVQAVEMEAAAIAQVAFQFSTPFVIIRSLSDIAGKESDISFDQFLETAALHSTKLVLNIVKQLD